MSIMRFRVRTEYDCDGVGYAVAEEDPYGHYIQWADYDELRLIAEQLLDTIKAQNALVDRLRAHVEGCRPGWRVECPDSAAQPAGHP